MSPEQIQAQLDVWFGVAEVTAASRPGGAKVATRNARQTKAKATKTGRFDPVADRRPAQPIPQKETPMPYVDRRPPMNIAAARAAAAARRPPLDITEARARLAAKKAPVKTVAASAAPKARKAPAARQPSAQAVSRALAAVIPPKRPAGAREVAWRVIGGDEARRTAWVKTPAKTSPRLEKFAADIAQAAQLRGLEVRSAVTASRMRRPIVDVGGRRTGRPWVSIVAAGADYGSVRAALLKTVYALAVGDEWTGSAEQQAAADDWVAKQGAAVMEINEVTALFQSALEAIADRGQQAARRRR